MNGLSLLDHIPVIRDPRQAWKIEHTLTDIILLTISAVIVGAEGWENIDDFGEDNLEYSNFKHGVPVYDTIARDYQSCFRQATATMLYCVDERLP